MANHFLYYSLLGAWLAGQQPAALQIGRLPANKPHNCSQCVRDNELYCSIHSAERGRWGGLVEVFKGAAGEEERRMGGGGSSLHHTDALLPIKPGCTELLLLQLINHGCSKELQAASFSRKGAGIILVNCKP